MNCQQFQEILQDLARYEGLDVVTLKEALEHAEHCNLCDDLMEEADALSSDLRALADTDASRQAPASIETALLEAFSQRNATIRQRARQRLVIAAGVLAVAAMALFAISLSRRLKPVLATPQTRPAIAANAGAAGNTSRVAQALPADAQHDALSVFEDEDGVSASFVPLTETFDTSSLDGDAVLRVALSRNDLANFGLSSNQVGKRPSGQVLADLIVSSDGIPQAIRLLPR